MPSPAIVQNKEAWLILGGIRSGKSRYAEQLALSWQATLPDERKLCYVATAEAHDSSMQSRIDQHQQRRGENWQTIEEPLHLGRIIADQSKENCLLLIDCLTLFVTNGLLSNPPSLNQHADQMMDALSKRQGPILFVSNETNLGLIGDTALGRQFQDESGLLHQRVATACERLVLMVAGHPLQVK